MYDSFRIAPVSDKGNAARTASWRYGLSWLLALCGLASAGCSSRSNPTQTTDDAPNPPLAVRNSALCSISSDGAEQEVYRFTAMNRKLSLYPEFASTLGIESVSDCESARKFAQAYGAYLTAHPGFDANQPANPEQEAEPSPPPDMKSSSSEQKIFGGVPAEDNPIVQIEFRNTRKTTIQGFPGSECTGTFIAKNWILTAAHCITSSAVDHCLSANIAPTDIFNCDPDWLNYGQWIIHFKLPTGLQRTTTTWALAYVHQDWLGRNAAVNPDLNPLLMMDGGLPGGSLDDLQDLVNAESGFSDHDVALLYLGDDTVLPPEVEKDGAKRLSIVQPDPSWPLSFFGWGLRPVDSPDAGDDLLQSAFDLNYTVDTNTITGQGNDVTLQSVACSGDSGGPLVRTVDVMTNANSVQTVEAVVGVLSTSTLNDAACKSNQALNGLKESTWARVDRNFTDFIEKKIRRWNGNPITDDSGFQCKLRPVEGEGADNQIAECWGPPCSSADACTTPGAYCSKAGQDLSTCPVCGNLGDCSCVVGQCLPGPTLDGGTEGGP